MNELFAVVSAGEGRSAADMKTEMKEVDGGGNENDKLNNKKTEVWGMVYYVFVLDLAGNLRLYVRSVCLTREFGHLASSSVSDGRRR